jgi:transposase
VPHPYSLDLRERVISFVDSGKTVSSASSFFKVTQNTIRKWLSLREETKSLAPKEGYQKGHSHKIKDHDALKQFVNANTGDIT